MSLQVSKWQAARRDFSYHPFLQFFLRLIVNAELDARKRRADGSPADEALLARAWFACETKAGARDEDYVTSFSHCCHVLNRDEDTERAMSLRIIDGYRLVRAPFGPLPKDAEVETVERWRLVQPEDEEDGERRVRILERRMWVKADDAADFDTDDCWQRLEVLLANPLADDNPAPVLEGYRCVPALDQGNLFEAAA